MSVQFHVIAYVYVSMSVHVFESMSVHACICVCLQKSEVNSDVIPCLCCCGGGNFCLLGFVLFSF